MSYDIQGKTAKARADYEAALAALETARSNFEQGAKEACEAALAREKALATKITACHTEAKAAEAVFKQSFEAAGYERTTAVRQALNRKNDAMAMAEELEVAHSQAQAQWGAVLMDASPKAQTLLQAHRKARETHALLSVYEAMGEACGTLQKAVALACGTLDHSGDCLGRPPISSADLRQQQQRNLAFIWEGLVQMALENQEPPDLPFAPVSISPLTTANLLTPAQLHTMRNQKAAGWQG